MAIAAEVERISGERGFLQACVDGTPLCSWSLHDTVLRPLAYTFLDAEGADTSQTLAIIKKELADNRDRLGSESIGMIADDRERRASDRAGKRSKSQRKKVKPSRAGEGMTSSQIADWINDDPGGLRVSDPNMASSMLRTYLLTLSR